MEDTVTHTVDLFLYHYLRVKAKAAMLFIEKKEWIEYVFSPNWWPTSP